MAAHQIRRTGEAQRLFAPLLGAVNAVVDRLAWIVGALVVLYLASGVTFVREGEVALVLRFGRLVGATPQEQVREPGLLLALPFPIDRVVRVPDETVREVRVDTLDASDEAHETDPLGETQGDTVDPEVEGYLVTGDRFLMQTRLVVRYRVKDALRFALGGDASERERLVHDAVQAAMVHAATRRVSSELWLDQADVLVEARLRAQDELDRLESGVELLAVVAAGIDYPRQVRRSVQDVLTASNDAGRSIAAALGYEQQELARIASQKSLFLSEARQYAERLVKRFDGQLAAYRQIEAQYHEAPMLVRTRLLFDRLTKIFYETSPDVTLVPPPPPGGKYSDMRFTTTPRRASANEADGADEGGGE